MNDPTKLNFQPLPQQPPQSDVMALLTSLAGLGLNIAGAATKTGAVGNQALQQAQQQVQQGVENRREQQKFANVQKQGQALWQRAQKEVADPLLRNEIKADVETYNVDDAAGKLRWNESVLRDQQRQDNFSAQSLAQQLVVAEEQLKGALNSSAERGDYYIKTRILPALDKSGGKGVDVGSLQVRLQELKDERGQKIFGDSRLARKKAQEVWAQIQGPGFLSRLFGGKDDRSYTDRFNYDPTSFDQIKAQAQQLEKWRAQLRDPKNLPRIQSEYLKMMTGETSAPAPAPGASAEIERVDPASGKTAVYDANTKQFLRWK